MNRQYIEREYNAEYKKGREKNFFIRNIWDGDRCIFFLDKITKGCSFTVKCTVKCTDNEEEMMDFMADYKLVTIFA